MDYNQSEYLGVFFLKVSIEKKKLFLFTFDYVSVAHSFVWLNKNNIK